MLRSLREFHHFNSNIIGHFLDWNFLRRADLLIIFKFFFLNFRLSLYSPLYHRSMIDRLRFLTNFWFLFWLFFWWGGWWRRWWRFSWWFFDLSGYRIAQSFLKLTLKLLYLAFSHTLENPAEFLSRPLSLQLLSFIYLSGDTLNRRSHFK